MPESACASLCVKSGNGGKDVWRSLLTRGTDVAGDESPAWPATDVVHL
jgi:hypothetical protein